MRDALEEISAPVAFDAAAGQEGLAEAPPGPRTRDFAALHVRPRKPASSFWGRPSRSASFRASRSARGRRSMRGATQGAAADAGGSGDGAGGSAGRGRSGRAR
jgi:hypothetical protein